MIFAFMRKVERRTPHPHPIVALNQVITEINREAKQSGVLRKGVRGLSSFILMILSELRAIICGKRKRLGKIGAQSQAFLSAIATLIAQKLGVSNPTAIGIAVLVLITLGKATRSGFLQNDRRGSLEGFQYVVC